MTNFLQSADLLAVLLCCLGTSIVSVAVTIRLMNYRIGRAYRRGLNERLAPSPVRVVSRRKPYVPMVPKEAIDHVAKSALADDLWKPKRKNN